MLKIIALILLTLLISFLVYVEISDIYLLKVSGNNSTNYYPYLRICISIIFSILILLIIKKKVTLYSLLNLLWIIPIVIIVFKNLFGFYNTEKLDYLMGKTLNDYTINQHMDHHGWLINEISIKNLNKIDTIYISENPSLEKKMYQLKNKSESKLVRSWITGYYYVSVKK